MTRSSGGNVLTGGQRIEHLLRLRRAHVAQQAITLFDAKGRPGQQAREHVIPLVEQAKQELGAFAQDGVFVLSTSGGKKPINATTMAMWAHEVVGDTIAGFKLKRIRSGIETLLAANGVSREIRGYLQSHGLTGVQARHYDAYTYGAEKLNALNILMKVLQLSSDEKKSSRGKRRPKQHSAEQQKG